MQIGLKQGRAELEQQSNQERWERGFISVMFVDLGIEQAFLFCLLLCATLLQHFAQQKTLKPRWTSELLGVWWRGADLNH